VKATVSRNNIEFTLPDSMGGHFKGYVTEKALIGKFERFSEQTRLLRRKSYWQ
jgi:hypothetical protein